MFQILRIVCVNLSPGHILFPITLQTRPPTPMKLNGVDSKLLFILMSKTWRLSQAHGPSYDAVVLSRCDFARKHIADVRLARATEAHHFDTVDLHYLARTARARLTGVPTLRRKAQEKQQLEHELIDQADETWVSKPRRTATDPGEAARQICENGFDIVESGSKIDCAIRRDYLFIGGLPTQNKNR